MLLTSRSGMATAAPYPPPVGDSAAFWEQRFHAWRSVPGHEGPSPSHAHGVPEFGAFPAGTEVDARLEGDDGWHNAVVVAVQPMDDGAVHYFVEYESYDIRPRHRLLGHWDVRARSDRQLTAAETKEGQMVLANYNFADPRRPGAWYDAVVTRVTYRRDSTAHILVRIFVPQQKLWTGDVQPFGNVVYEIASGGRHPSYPKMPAPPPRNNSASAMEAGLVTPKRAQDATSGDSADTRTRSSQSRARTVAQLSQQRRSMEPSGGNEGNVRTQPEVPKMHELSPLHPATSSEATGKGSARVPLATLPANAQRKDTGIANEPDAGAAGNPDATGKRGVTCHQCRQAASSQRELKKKDRQRKPCSSCTKMWCEGCLSNRYGLKIADLPSDWACPVCTRTCNCSVCLHKAGRAPTGILAHIAKSGGFGNVAALLAATVDAGRGSGAPIPPPPHASERGSAAAIPLPSHASQLVPVNRSGAPLFFVPYVVPMYATPIVQDHGGAVHSAVHPQFHPVEANAAPVSTPYDHMRAAHSELIAQQREKAREEREAAKRAHQEAVEATREAERRQREAEKEAMRAERLAAAEADKARRVEERAKLRAQRMLARGLVDEFEGLPEGVQPLPDNECLVAVASPGELDVGAVLMIVEFFATFGTPLDVRRNVAKDTLEAALLGGGDGFEFLAELHLPLIKEIYEDETEGLKALDRRQKPTFLSSTFPGHLHAVLRDLGGEENRALADTLYRTDYPALQPAEKLRMLELLVNITLTCETVANTILEASERLHDIRRVFKQELAEEQAKLSEARRLEMVEDDVSDDGAELPEGEGAATHAGGGAKEGSARALVKDVELRIDRLKSTYADNTRRERSYLGGRSLGSDRHGRRHFLLPSGSLEGILVQDVIGQDIHDAVDGGDEGRPEEQSMTERYYVIPSIEQISMMEVALLTHGDCEGPLRKAYASSAPELVWLFDANRPKKRKSPPLSGSYGTVVKFATDSAHELESMACDALNRLRDTPDIDDAKVKAYARGRSKYTTALARAGDVVALRTVLGARMRDLAEIFGDAWPPAARKLVDEGIGQSTSYLMLLYAISALGDFVRKAESKFVVEEESEDDEEEGGSGSDSTDESSTAGRQRRKTRNSGGKPKPTKPNVSDRAKRAAERERRAERLTSGSDAESTTSGDGGDDDSDSAGDQYEMEAILDRRVIRGVEKFLIKWKGYDESQNTWEPRENILCKQVLEDFERSRRKTIASQRTAAGRGEDASESGTSSIGQSARRQAKRKAEASEESAPRKRRVATMEGAGVPTNERVAALRKSRRDRSMTPDAAAAETASHASSKRSRLDSTETSDLDDAVRDSLRVDAQVEDPVDAHGPPAKRATATRSDYSATSRRGRPPRR